jgi:hypothetical protein
LARRWHVVENHREWKFQALGANQLGYSRDDVDLAGQRWGSYGISVPGMAVGAVGMFSSKAFMENIKSLGDRDLRIKK